MQREQILRLAQAHGVELTEAQVAAVNELTDADLETLTAGKVMDPGFGYPGWGYGPGFGYGPGWGGFGPRWGGGALFIRW